VLFFLAFLFYGSFCYVLVASAWNGSLWCGGIEAMKGTSMVGTGKEGKIGRNWLLDEKHDDRITKYQHTRAEEMTERKEIGRG